MILSRHVPVLLALWALLVPALTGAAALPPEGRQVLVQAEALLDADKPEEAARIVDGYLAGTLETPPPEAHLLLGMARHQAGDKPLALKAFLAGYEIHPEHRLLCLNSAVVLYETEQYQRAGQLFEKAFTLQEEPCPDILHQAAAAYFRHGDFAASARVMEKLLALVQAPKREWTTLAAHALAATGQWQRAETLVLKLLETTPDDAACWELLASIHSEAQHLDKAAAALDICYRLRPPTTAELERLADLYRYLRAPLRAAAVLERAYTSPNPEQARRIAALYAASGRTGKSVQTLQRLSGGQPPALLLAAGKILFRARRFKHAGESLDACLKHSPGNAEARFLRALCAWEESDWDLARQEFRRAAANKDYATRADSALAALESLREDRRNPAPDQ